MRHLPSMSNSSTVTVVNNSMSRLREKRTNEQEQIDTTLQVENHQNVSNNLVENPTNASNPGLVEKLMQQLNDLKEMVCIINFCTQCVVKWIF